MNEVKLKDRVMYKGKPMIVTDFDKVSIPNIIELTDVNGIKTKITEYELYYLITFEKYKVYQLLKLAVIFLITTLIYSIFDSLISVIGLLLMIVILINTLKSINEYYKF